MSARSGRWIALAIGAVAALGWLLRAWPFFAQGDWWRVPVDYDDGVYFSAAALLWDGVLPYRDFTFVHPPGIALFYLPLGALSQLLGAKEAFSLSRWVATLVGAANIALCGRIAWRAGGPVAGIAAAIFYACYPEIVSQERNPFLEPVLNLFGLLAASAWLSPRLERQPRWALLAGAFLGLAVAVKVWAAAWVIACLLSLPAARARAFAFLASGAALTAALAIGPLALADPAAFLEQTVAFHAWRPPDGIAELGPRIIEIFRRHLVIAAMAVAAIAWEGYLAIRRRSPPRRAVRLFAAAQGAFLAAFLFARTYWQEYNSALAPAEAVLAGLFAARFFAALAPLHRFAPLAAGLALAAAPIPSLRLCFRQARSSDWDMQAFGAAVRELVGPGGCYLAFEPTWGLTGGRLPTVRPGARVVVDVYAEMLLAARRTGVEATTIDAALHAPAAQERIRSIIEGCEHLSLGWRGDWQLDGATRAWIAERYELRHPPPGGRAIDIWRRR